jgi:hypothetical protein
MPCTVHRLELAVVTQVAAQGQQAPEGDLRPVFAVIPSRRALHTLRLPGLAGAGLVSAAHA